MVFMKEWKQHRRERGRNKGQNRSCNEVNHCSGPDLNPTHCSHVGFQVDHVRLNPEVNMRTILGPGSAGPGSAGPGSHRLRICRKGLYEMTCP